MTRRRWLVLGGTAWLGREVARAAQARGHEVTCLARGESGPVAEGVLRVRADRDEPGAYDALEGTWDVVVDVARQPGQVRSALAALADRAGRWTFVSTANVYADLSGPLREEDPVRSPAAGDVVAPEQYGEGKVACELAVLEHPEPLVLRPGLVVGPGDPSDRFGYWPARLASAGSEDVLVPDLPDARCQVVDVRDLARFVVEAVGSGVSGVLNTVGPSRPLDEVLREVAALVGHSGRLVPVDAARLAELGVQPWAGDRSLPLWLPTDYQGMATLDTARAEAAGLTHRPFADTVLDTLADERERGPDRPRAAGLSRADEVDLLARLAGD